MSVPKHPKPPLLQGPLQVGRAPPGRTHFLPSTPSDPSFFLAGTWPSGRPLLLPRPPGLGDLDPVWPSARTALPVVPPRCLPSSLLSLRLWGLHPVSPCLLSISSEPGWHHPGCLLLPSVLIDSSLYSRCGIDSSLYSRCADEEQRLREVRRLVQSHPGFGPITLTVSAVITSRPVTASRDCPRENGGAEAQGPRQRQAAIPGVPLFRAHPAPAAVRRSGGE